MDGAARLRLEFTPIKSIRDPDVRGSIYLDTLTAQIIRTTMFVEIPSPKAPATDTWEIRIDTWFRELVPDVPVVDGVCTRTTVSSTTSRTQNRMSGLYALEMQRLVGIEFDADGPPLT